MCVIGILLSIFIRVMEHLRSGWKTKKIIGSLQSYLCGLVMVFAHFFAGICGNITSLWHTQPDFGTS